MNVAFLTAILLLGANPNAGETHVLVERTPVPIGQAGAEVLERQAYRPPGAQATALPAAVTVNDWYGKRNSDEALVPSESS